MKAPNEIIYTAVDIHHYLTGKLTPAAMHAMERAALTDPFLAEALEGFAALPAMKNTEGFSHLQDQLNKLKNKIGGKNATTISNAWWKIAAAVSLIIIAAAVIRIMTTTPVKQTATTIIITKPLDIKSAHIDTIQVASTKQSLAEHKPVVSRSYHPTVTATAIADITTPPTRVAVNDSPIVYAHAEMAQQPDTPTAIDGNNKLDGYFNASVQKQATTKEFAFKKSLPQKTYAGKIIDSNNNPIAYASLYIDRHTTRTDANGLFNLTAKDSDAEIAVGADGYNTKVVPFQWGETKTIILSKALLKKDTSIDGRVRSIINVLYKSGAEPKEGWTDYLQYLVDQLSYSAYDDGRQVKGQMILTFKIDANSMPSDFLFEQSIDADVDKAVTQLILNGPSWIKTKGVATPGMVRLRIIF